MPSQRFSGTAEPFSMPGSLAALCASTVSVSISRSPSPYMKLSYSRASCLSLTETPTSKVPVPVTFSMLQKSPSWTCSVMAGVARTGSRDKR